MKKYEKTKSNIISGLQTFNDEDINKKYIISLVEKIYDKPKNLMEEYENEQILSIIDEYMFSVVKDVKFNIDLIFYGENNNRLFINKFFDRLSEVSLARKEKQNIIFLLSKIVESDKKIIEDINSIYNKKKGGLF